MFPYLLHVEAEALSPSGGDFEGWVPTKHANFISPLPCLLFFFLPFPPSFIFCFSSILWRIKKLPGNDGSVYSFSSPEQAAVTQPNTTQHSLSNLSQSWFWLGQGLPSPILQGFCRPQSGIQMVSYLHGLVTTGTEKKDTNRCFCLAYL